MPSVEVNGAALEYAASGAGEPLVLVHGSASDYRTWQAQQRAFGRRFRTIAYSRRYHWPNAPIPAGADYSMLGHVDDLQALLQALDAAPAHLVGHSYGAFLCLLLAARAPHLVRTLVLTEPPAITLFVSDPPRPAEILRLLVSRPRAAAAILAFGARGVAPATRAAKRGDLEAAMRVFGRAILGREAYRRLSAERLGQVRANAMQAEFLGSGFAPLAPAEVAGVRSPTLLITSEHGARVFHRVAERLAELLPEVERVTIAGTSHIVHEDDADAHDAAVLSFLARHRRRAA